MQLNNTSKRKLGIFHGKKGLMLKFLLGLVLALIIFVPTCIFTSKLFRLSDQAQDNFLEFTKEIKDISDKPDQERKTFLLLLDDDTFITIFKQKEDVMFFSSSQQFEEGEIVVQKIFKTPGQCTEFACACLCKKPIKESTTGSLIDDVGLGSGFIEETYGCEDLLCRTIENADLVDSWGIQREGGQRRVLINLEKIGGTVKLSRNNE
ncbi:MAG TPA: hypothetical protein VJI98_04910 [Candidatus Nanoarchaeia archaeon]|nr:hypothetical protein [Candidatus Nanoarchaeia archaeon]